MYKEIYENFYQNIDSALLRGDFKLLNELFNQMEEFCCMDEKYILYKIMFYNNIFSIEQLEYMLNRNINVKISNYDKKILLGLKNQKKIQDIYIIRLLNSIDKFFDYSIYLEDFEIKKYIEYSNRKYTYSLCEGNKIIFGKTDRRYDRRLKIELENIILGNNENFTDMKRINKKVYLMSNAKKIYHLSDSTESCKFNFEEVVNLINTIQGHIIEWYITNQTILILTNFGELYLYSLEFNTEIKKIKEVKAFTVSSDHILICSFVDELYFLRKAHISDYKNYKVDLNFELKTIIKLTSGNNHFGILTSDNRLLVFGDNNKNQLGLGKKNSHIK